MTDFKKLSDSELQRQLEIFQVGLEGPRDSDDIQRLMYDLQVHQIELELQNRELREAQRRLEQARDRYADLYDFAPVGYLTLDPTGKIVEINLTGARLLGVERSRLLGRPLSSFLAPEETWCLFDHLRLVFKGGEKAVTELKLLPRHGQPLAVCLESIAVDSPEGRSVCRTALIDITERKQAETALRQAQQVLEGKVQERTVELTEANTLLSDNRRQLQAILDNTTAVIYVKDIEGRYLLINPRYEELFGFSQEEIIGQTDHDVFPKAIADAFLAHDRQVLEARAPMEFDETVAHADGEHTYLSLKVPLYGNDGIPYAVCGISTDITERTRNEENRRLAAAVFENTDQGILITDADCHIVAVNRAFTRMTGYPPAEVLGKDPRLLHSDRQDETFYETLRRSFNEQGRWQGELWNRYRDGSIRPAWGNLTVVRDDQGRITHHVGVFSDISRIKEAEDRLQYLAHYDPLTGVPNRLLFEARLENALQRAKRQQYRVALLFLDLDRFKVINDTLGHRAGDRLLQTLAQRLQDCLRGEDTVARLGGDEFMVILDEIAHPEDVAPIAKKLLNTLSRPVPVEDRELVIGASLGISVYPDDADNGENLCKAADAALYLAKQRGRGHYQFYTAELTTQALHRLALEHELRQALERHEFVLYYQPQIVLDSGQMAGAEALLRWQHPRLGMLAPDQFLAVAEDTKLIDFISDWVLRQACTQAMAWQDWGLPALRVSVNLAARTLLYDPRLLDKVQVALAESGLRPHQLELEITEKALQTAEPSIAMLTALKELGVTLAIDDFGTGYSCLNSLKQLPIDALKIDRSFIRDIPHDPNDTAISTAIIVMGHSLNLRVIAEGVATSEQWAFLRDKGCDEMQGYFLSQPVLADVIAQMLKENKRIA